MSDIVPRQIRVFGSKLCTGLCINDRKAEKNNTIFKIQTLSSHITGNTDFYNIVFSIHLYKDNVFMPAGPERVSVWNLKLCRKLVEAPAPVISLLAVPRRHFCFVSSELFFWLVVFLLCLLCICVLYVF